MFTTLPTILRGQILSLCIFAIVFLLVGTPLAFGIPDDKGRELSFPHTDNNDQETLIIRSNAETYYGYGSADVYFSVENQGLPQSIDLQLYFQNNEGAVVSFSKLVQDVNYNVKADIIGSKENVCSVGWIENLDAGFDSVYYCIDERTSIICDSIIGNNNVCRQNQVIIGERTEVRQRDEWQPLGKGNPSDTKSQRDSRNYGTILRADYQTTSKATEFILTGETKYFKAEITFPVKTVNEFYIEAFGASGDYGLLDPWFDSDWLLKKVITINSAEVGSNLINFPFLINFTDTDLRDSAQLDGDDILFVDSDDATQLSHEIERYDSSNGYLTAWVRVNVTSTVDKQFFMYFNNSAASNQEDITGVWTGRDYWAVFHINTNATSTTLSSAEYSGDSTRHDAVIATSATNGTISIVPGELITNGTEAIQFGAWDFGVPHTPFTDDGDFTLSWWGKWPLSAIGGSFNTIGVAGNDDHPGIVKQSTGFIGIINNPGFFHESSGIDADAFSAGWHYITVRVEGTGAGSNTTKFYVDDGIQGGNGTINTRIDQEIGCMGSGVFGVPECRSGSAWGEWDEWRVSNDISSDDWIDFEFCNQLATSYINASEGATCSAYSMGAALIEVFPPVAPTNLAIVEVLPTAHDLTWDQTDLISASVNGFIIYQNVSDTSEYIILEANTSSTDLFFNVTGLDCLLDYAYKVAAHNINGTGPNSTEASDSPQCAQTATVIGPTQGLSIIEWVVYGFFAYGAMLMLMIGIVKDIPGTRTTSLLRIVFILPGIIGAGLLAGPYESVILEDTNSVLTSFPLVGGNTTQQLAETNFIQLQNPVWLIFHYAIMAVMIIYVISQVLTMLTTAPLEANRNKGNA